MTESEITTRIIAFAQHCGTGQREPEAIARRRGWLDGEGWPTEDGRQLVAALDDQSATRSVFRTVL
jgi:hypothetical protein